MSRTIVECVPNFSEGRDPARVEAIVEAIRSVAGIVILNREMDADHNRSVVTFAGPAESIGEAAFRGVRKAVELIDLRRHTGVHPRIGAADVVPFVPVAGVSLAECARIAGRVGLEIWERLRVPVYLYEAAARRPENVNLENVRRGQFEGLREEVRTNPTRHPDFGEAELHESAGATVVGARKFLIAYNINLTTPDVEIARRIARTVRFSSGGFRYVKAMGVLLTSRNLAQVSMNLTDFEQTPLHRVFEAVRTEAERYGVDIAGSEIVGLIPKKALEMTAEWYLRAENFTPDVVLENRLAEAVATDELSAPAAAAMAAELAASLGSLVFGPAFDADRRYFGEAARRDLPLETAEAAAAMRERLRTLAATAPRNFRAEVATALELADAAVNGALAIVRLNLESITDKDLAASIKERIQALATHARHT